MENSVAENTLIEQARGGAVEAFEEIVRTHHRLVRSFVVRHLGDRQVADDVSQDVFVAAFRSLDRYHGTGTVASWLLGIARHHILTYLRNKPRAATGLAETLDEAHLACLDNDPFDEAAEVVRIDALRSCIQSLESPQRDVLVRYYYGSESALEIARSLNKPSGTVRMMLLRIRRQLRHCIDGKVRPGGPLR